MQRFLPRFFRCFLIAALAASVVGPLAPTGAAIGESVVCGHPAYHDPDDLAGPPKLSVSKTAAPGQKVWVKGSGFNGNANVRLELASGGKRVVVAGEGAADHTPPIKAKPNGAFLCTATVPFDDAVTAMPGPKTWTATETSTNDGRSASSSVFIIERRALQLFPMTASPGDRVRVIGSGWGVKTQGGVVSQVTLEVSTAPPTKYGPFRVNDYGGFGGEIIAPPDSDVTWFTVTATDNNGPAAEGGTGGFSANQTATTVLGVPTGGVTVTPSVASTGEVFTVSGTGFPARTTLSEVRFGDANALPRPPPMTDVNGNIVLTMTVPAACRGASCPYGLTLGDRVPICVRVAGIVGCTEFTIPNPFISLLTDTARPGDKITITGSGFRAYASVDTISIGQTNQTPVPNPLTDGVGNFTTDVTVPYLNPGAYTVTVRTRPSFTATALVRILRPTARPPEEALQALISRGLLTLAAASPPGGTSFGAYVPGLPGDTLAGVLPNSVLVLTLARDARISVSGQSPVDVTAGTPTFFALGLDVFVEVIEHGA